MLYQAYQIQTDVMSQLHRMAQQLGSSTWLQQTERSLLRQLSAACETLSSLRLTHSRPAFGIDSVTIEGRRVGIEEQQRLELPFGSLLHFRKTGATDLPPQPPVLLVAPLSGHFATLLRETLRTLLQDHDVYITDWHNARDVGLQHGCFGLEDYISYLMRFIETIGPGCHVVAVCQPCVAALAATALMTEDEHPAQPRSLTLMAGPVDCRINPTAVNRLATSKPIGWFEQHLISRVPWPHPGFMRRVYPGFVQLSAFMSMNLERHKQSFKQLYQHLVEGRTEEARQIQAFYEEYLAVNDLPAEFYLETIAQVFQTYDLPLGQLRWQGRRVNPAAIRRTALMTVEGERDDICAVGQTMAAQELCPNIRPYRKQHYVQTGVGHYGVFSGSKWNQQIYPRVRDMIHAHSA